jgi:hypothetical protein
LDQNIFTDMAERISWISTSIFKIKSMKSVFKPYCFFACILFRKLRDGWGCRQNSFVRNPIWHQIKG